MTLIIMGFAARLGPGRIGSSGCVRSSAWIWLFSSTQKHQSTLRRIKVQADDVAHFLNKLWIGRKLERSMR